MCGLSGRENILFGHADGTVSSFKGDEICKESTSIESMTCIEQGFVAALDNGDLVARTPSSDQIWTIVALKLQLRLQVSMTCIGVGGGILFVGIWK